MIRPVAGDVTLVNYSMWLEMNSDQKGSVSY
jgi:hypothetical protein